MKTLKWILCMALMPIVSHAATVEVSLDVDQKEDAINPMIYGQFIEHLGRCIYGGIWAEMLEDRKFYFPVEDVYDPYKALQDTAFPVVGASPWQVMGAEKSVMMVKEDAFVGDHTPLVGKGSGIRQRDLALKADMGYEGYVWLKSKSGKASVKVSLVGDGEIVATATFRANSKDYKKFTFKGMAIKPTEKAMLEIEALDGDVFVGTASLMPSDNVRGMRSDTLALLKELDATVYRWPGGNFVSGYDWRDGIGDRDRRPPRKNPAWTGVEYNDFGTDEFLDFCREIAADPVIAANTGFGDHYSAAQWVEYCNASTHTIGGSWRKQNGHKEPYGVKYWCVGNEMWGNWQLGYMHLDQYVLKHNRTAEAMLEVDDSLVLIGSGDIRSRSQSLSDPSKERGWSEGLLQECADKMDLISEHFYCGRTPWTEDQREPVLDHVTRVKLFIRLICDQHRELQAKMDHLKDKMIPIAMDEWNYWHREYVYGELGCVYELQDALGIAEGFNEYYRQSDLVQMAYYAQTVNVIGAIKTTKTQAEFAATGLVLKMYRANYGKIPLKLGDTFAPLDVTAALDDEGKVLTVSVVNPLAEESVVKLQLKGATLADSGEMHWVTGESETAFNTPGQPRKVDEYAASAVSVVDGLKVPALSCTIYRIALQ